MGTDDLFRRHKERSRNRIKREKNKRSPHARILVVCEGRQTEPNYINALRRHCALNAANFEVRGTGMSPARVVQHAIEEYKRSKKSDDAFDRVFCVFDRDDHFDYDRALSKLHDRGKFAAITSMPCFEYWLLLHYEYSTKPYKSQPGKSAAEQVINDLKRHLPQYRKEDKTIFFAVEKHTHLAKQHAKRSLKAAAKSGTDNPSTMVHLLVEYLERLK